MSLYFSPNIKLIQESELFGAGWGGACGDVGHIWYTQALFLAVRTSVTPETAVGEGDCKLETLMVGIYTGESMGVRHCIAKAQTKSWITF